MKTLILLLFSTLSVFAQDQGPGVTGALSGVINLTVRGTSQYATIASSPNVPFPAGTQAGDYVLIFGACVYGLTNNGTGWTLVYNGPGGNVTGFVWNKNVTAGDVSTGYVNFTAGVSAIFFLVDFSVVGSIRESPNTVGPSSANPYTITTSSAVLTSDMLFTMCASRDSGAATVTMSPGTVLYTGGDGIGYLSWGFLQYTPASAGVQNTTCNFSPFFRQNDVTVVMRYP